MSGRSARGSGGSDRGTIACVVCIIRIRESACLFFIRWGALWPVACAGCRRTWDDSFEELLRPRKSARSRTKHAAGALVLAGHLVRGQGTPHATGQRAPMEKKRQADVRILITHTAHAIAPRSDPPLPRALRPLTPTERLLRTSGMAYQAH